ncbi:MAG: HlyD family efflux transporter periplasmic adaptor subunit [Amylibacter sp.]|nr:HlyD family efflux transporter periplasmic adaptor subunit [Amylibacter sp.]
MGKFRLRQFGQRNLPLARQDLVDFIDTQQKKSSILLKLQSVLLLGFAVPIFLLAAFILIFYFYNAPIIFSMRSWVQVRNLTPVVTVETPVSGALEQIFVSQGQLVKKGELLGAIQTASVKLDYEETRRNFVDKIVELHCLVSLLSHSSVLKLPYDAQILVDQMAGQYDGTYKIEQCERELLRNIIADQSLEETIAALEDQSRLLKNIVKLRGAIENTFGPSVTNPFDLDEDFEFPFGEDQAALKKSYRDQYFPMLQFAQVQQKLQEVRKEYFLRKLQKEDELEAAIKQTTQEMRYLDKQLRDLNKKLEDNYIYASITGTVVGSTVSKVGAYFKEDDTIFKLQPIENKFQVSILLNEENSHRFEIGASTTIALANNLEGNNQLKAKTVTVVRKTNGKLEAILDLEGNSKRNSEIILATGYRGEGSQRFPANITIGHQKAWNTISRIILRKPR